MVAILAALAVPAGAQEGPVTFEFSFSNPGARSMGLGGAFAALADDATAAFANPAGLAQLLEPEVSLEGRWWSYDTPFVAGGRISGEPTGEGVDTVMGIRYGKSSQDLLGVSFVSLVYPGDKWSLAAYRHTWADFQHSRRLDGLFGFVDDEFNRSEDVVADADFRVVNNGVAGAYELTDTLSIGLGVVYFQAEMLAYSEEFTHAEEASFDPNPWDYELLDTTYSNTSEDTGFVFHAGFLWRPSERWSIGGYYRQGPTLDVRVLEVTGPAEEELPPGSVDKDFVTPLDMPDVFGVGVAYRSPDNALTLSLEWDRVCYSNIGEDLDGTIHDAGKIKLSDGDEVRLGAEYVLTGTKPLVVLRAGVWRDPAHGLAAGPEAESFEPWIYTGGDEQIHWAGGLGLVFKDFQLDLGFDFSDTVDQASLSFVYRF
jgi:hypothetical protein